MRIVTRPDFDGIVCAILLLNVEKITESIKWVHPGDMQKRRIEVRPGDIIANLPFCANCSLWFDHHYSNQPAGSFNGAFRIAPSAARVIFDYYGGRFEKDYTELIEWTDRIDSADLSRDQVNHPEKYPYILLSMTIDSHQMSDVPYWNRLVDLAGTSTIDQVMGDTAVRQRCRQVVEENRVYAKQLVAYTRLEKQVAITDFRPLSPSPKGNRFLIYALFPEAVVNVKIRYDDSGDHVVVSVGHSIFNRKCQVNAGALLSQFGGGGHRGAGSCMFHVSKADDYIPEIIDILIKNEANT